MSNPDGLSVPATINLDYARGGDGSVEEYFGRPMLKATSPEYPGLAGASPEAVEAVQYLMFAVQCAQDRIEDAQPLPSTMVKALNGAGYPPELIDAWHETMRGNLRRYRRDVGAALSALKEYADHGVPAVTACAFIEAGLDAEDAGKVHGAGCTPSEARPYVEAAAPSADDWWHWPDFDVVPWIIARFPVERCTIYAGRCSPEQAAEWETVVSAHDIADEDLRAMLHAGFTPEGVAANAEMYARSGASLGEAASTQRALLASARITSHSG